MSPGHDVRFADLLEDLELVLSKDDFSMMRGEVIGLLHDMMNDLGGATAAAVLDDMGVDDIRSTFFTFA